MNLPHFDSGVFSHLYFVPESIESMTSFSFNIVIDLAKNTAILLCPVVWPDAESFSDGRLELYPYRIVVELLGVIPTIKCKNLLNRT